MASFNFTQRLLERKEIWTLSKAPISLKVALTFFLLMVGVGHITTLANVYLRTGFDPQGTVAYIRGQEEEYLYPKSLLELVEISHFHLYSMAFLFLFLGGMVAFTSIKEWLKVAIVSLAFLSSLSEVASLWLIRYLSPLFAPLFSLSGLLLSLTTFLLIIIPFWEMWLKKR